MTEPSALTLHLVSDSTGNTIASAARASAIRFDSERFVMDENVFIRSRAQIEQIVARIRQPALILHTIADAELQQHLTSLASANGIEAIGVLDSTVAAMAKFLGPPGPSMPGQQHRIDKNYQNRIDAIDFAMAHDDGLDPDRLLAADVILVGVSRSSKTPTCIYLGYQGIRAANVPLVPHVPAPPGLLAAMEAGVPVIGLVVTPARLAQVRAHRLVALNRSGTAGYADIDTIRSEVSEARLFFERHDIPVIDVSRRSIEETAAAILVEVRKQIHE